MDITNLSPDERKVANVPFPYNHPELLAQYRGKDLVVVVDKFLGVLGEIEFKAIQKYYRFQDREPVIICVPAN